MRRLTGAWSCRGNLGPLTRWLPLAIPLLVLQSNCGLFGSTVDLTATRSAARLQAHPVFKGPPTLYVLKRTLDGGAVVLIVKPRLSRVARHT